MYRKTIDMKSNFFEQQFAGVIFMSISKTVLEIENIY